MDIKFSVSKKEKEKGSMHLQGTLSPEKVKPGPEGRYALSPILMPRPIFLHNYWIDFTFPDAFSAFRVLLFLFFHLCMKISAHILVYLLNCKTQMSLE